MKFINNSFYFSEGVNIYDVTSCGTSLLARNTIYPEADVQWALFEIITHFLKQYRFHAFGCVFAVQVVTDGAESK